MNVAVRSFYVCVCAWKAINYFKSDKIEVEIIHISMGSLVGLIFQVMDCFVVGV